MSKETFWYLPYRNECPYRDRNCPTHWYDKNSPCDKCVNDLIRRSLLGQTLSVPGDKWRPVTVEEIFVSYDDGQPVIVIRGKRSKGFGKNKKRIEDVTLTATINQNGRVGPLKPIKKI